MRTMAILLAPQHDRDRRISVGAGLWPVWPATGSSTNPRPSTSRRRSRGAASIGHARARSRLYHVRKRALRRTRTRKPLPGAVLRPRLVDLVAAELRSHLARPRRIFGDEPISEFGFDVWTMDHEITARSSRSEGNSDIASGVEDLKPVALELVAARDRTAEAASLRRIPGALQRRRLRVVEARARRSGWFSLPSPTSARARRPWPSGPRRSTTTRRITGRLRDSDMIRSIFTRDKPGTRTRHRRVPRDQELKFGHQFRRHLSRLDRQPAVVDPAQGAGAGAAAAREYDGIATVDDLVASTSSCRAGGPGNSSSCRRPPIRSCSAATASSLAMPCGPSSPCRPIATCERGGRMKADWLPRCCCFFPACGGSQSPAFDLLCPWTKGWFWISGARPELCARPAAPLSLMASATADRGAPPGRLPSRRYVRRPMCSEAALCDQAG